MPTDVVVMLSGLFAGVLVGVAAWALNLALGRR